MKLKDMKIYYINMDKHVDRRKKMEAMFDEHGFTDVTRVAGVVDTDPIIGCAKAYLKVFDQAPNSNVVILEDDCMPTKWFDPNMEMSFDEDIDSVYLGISMWCRHNLPEKDNLVEYHKHKTVKETVDEIFSHLAGMVEPYYLQSGPYMRIHPLQPKGIRKIDNVLSTHAIFYKSQEMIKNTIRVIESTLEKDTPRHIDCLYAQDLQRKLNVVAFDKPIFYQSSSKTVTNFSISNYVEDLWIHLSKEYIPREDPLPPLPTTEDLFGTPLPEIGERK